MRILLTLLRKDLTMLRRNRGALILSLIVPAILIAIVGQVFGLGRKNPGPAPKGIRLAVVNESKSPGAAKLVEALEAEPTFRVITSTTNPDKSERPLTAADIRPMIRDRQLQYALVIPANLIAEDRIGLNLETYADPRNSIEKQLVDGMLQKTIFSNAPQLFGASLKIRAKKFAGEKQLTRFNHTLADAIADTFDGDRNEIFAHLQSGDYGFEQLLEQIPATAAPVPPGLRRLDTSETPAAKKAEAAPASSANDFLSSLVRIKNEQVVGKEVKNPEATRVVGGYAVMFLLFALSASSAAFFDEKRSGIFQRLLAAPVRPSHLLWSRFLYGILFGLAQLVALFAVGSALYDIDVLSHPVNLLLMCTATAAACTAFGMLLAAFTRSQQAAASLSTLLVLVMSACGGAWFPISFLPPSMQHIAPFTIVYWALEGFSQVLWAGNSFAQILPTFGVLAGIAIVVMAIAVVKFSRSKIFE